MKYQVNLNNYGVHCQMTWKDSQDILNKKVKLQIRVQGC